jgi:hypothetical protein
MISGSPPSAKRFVRVRALERRSRVRQSRARQRRGGAPRGAPSSLTAYRVRGLANPRTSGVRLPTSAFAEGPHRYLAMVPAPSPVAARAWSATSGAKMPATRPAAPPARTATYPGALCATEIPAFLEAATPSARRRFDLLRAGTLRSEEPQHGGRGGGAGELYRLAPRDRSGIQTHR